MSFLTAIDINRRMMAHRRLTSTQNTAQGTYY